MSGSEPIGTTFEQMIEYDDRRDFHNVTDAPADKFSGVASPSNTLIVRDLTSRVHVGINGYGEGR
jgi:hypothetical protein